MIIATDATVLGAVKGRARRKRLHPLTASCAPWGSELVETKGVLENVDHASGGSN
jgi:hypothetical protein